MSLFHSLDHSRSRSLAALLAMFHAGPFNAFLVLLFLGVLRIVQDYVIYPRLIGQGIHLHPLAVIFAILAGEKLAGVAGIFLAIPVVAILTVSYRHWMEHRGSEGIADLLEPNAADPAKVGGSRCSNCRRASRRIHAGRNGTRPPRPHHRRAKIPES